MKNIGQIIKESVQGNPEQQRMLYEMFRNQWFMLSLRYAKNKSQAEDIFQEGLIQIYKDLHQFDETKSAFGTWSSRVMINAALKYLKKHNWMNNFTDLDVVQDTEDVSPDIFHGMAANELTQMIQSLPMGYKIVFNMFAIEGFSHKEIAEKLGISIGTSKSQLSKARKELRYKLETVLKISHYE